MFRMLWIHRGASSQSLNCNGCSSSGEEITEHPRKKRNHANNVAPRIQQHKFWCLCSKMNPNLKISTNQRYFLQLSAFKHYGSGSMTTLGRYHLLADTGSYMDFGYIIYNINTTKQDLSNIPPYENGPAHNHSIFLNWTGIHNHSPQVSELSPKQKSFATDITWMQQLLNTFNKGVRLGLKIKP